MNPTLVLNANYSPLSLIPISSISWKDAIKVAFLGHAKPIEYYDDWLVRSPTTSFRVPAVIISSTYIKKKNGVRFSRNNLLIRDNFTCQYCDKTLNSHDLTIDHVIPRVRGGKTRWDNVVCACYVCNSIKGHRSNMKPRSQPVKPDYYRLLDNAKKMPMKVPSDKWLPYLNWDPGLITVTAPDRG